VSEKILIAVRTKRDMIKMCLGLHESTRYSCPTLMILAFSGQIFEKYSNIKYYENRPVGAELFHADRWTDMMKLIITFGKFANAPKNR
jgi:hypothetical protein